MQAGYFEGDMNMEGLHETDRAATTDSKRLWPGGIIWYAVDSTLDTSRIMRIIRRSMDWIEDKTCLRFIKRAHEKDYVRIVSKEGCYSYLGRNGGEQELSLGNGCHFVGTVTHELLHAVGFFHEHSRPDRDDYIDIFPENIIKGFLSSFDKVEPSQIRYLTKFDYQSVMLYGSNAFSRGPDLPSMLTKDGRTLRDVYDKAGLSQSDIVRINALYNCKRT
ncbi:astacin-like metalloprotease toxin 1 [Dermacentor andersoni]|uniref:astacin-like metalloprotease toxin 1 n=1 Tax=Dermacentor andersoni TaxID=34620 RepID=UPI003B3B1707